VKVAEGANRTQEDDMEGNKIYLQRQVVTHPSYSTPSTAVCHDGSWYQLKHGLQVVATSPLFNMKVSRKLEYSMEVCV
jgi:hypothetical protein